MASNRFLGAQYPLMSTPKGFFAQKSGTDQIKADLLQLLLTNPGERVMLPDYGTPLRTLIFEPNDQSLAIQAKQMIANAILTWEPRIVVTGINVTLGSDTPDLNPSDPLQDVEHILGIQISFVDPQNINQVQDLVIQMPIGS